MENKQITTDDILNNLRIVREMSREKINTRKQMLDLTVAAIRYGAVNIATGTPYTDKDVNKLTEELNNAEYEFARASQAIKDLETPKTPHIIVFESEDGKCMGSTEMLLKAPKIGDVIKSFDERGNSRDFHITDVGQIQHLSVAEGFKEIYMDRIICRYGKE